MKVFRQILFPMIILILPFIVAHLTKDGFSQNIRMRQICSNWGWSDRADSDILFIGSSRSFRAINLSEIERGLKDAGHNINNVEMIWTDFPNIPVKIWALEEYLEHGEAPKIIIVENTMAQLPRDLNEIKNDGSLTLLPIAQRYMPEEIYLRLQDYLNSQYNDPWTRIFRRGYTTPIEYKVNQWRATVYDFIDSPEHATNTREIFCPGVFQSWNTGFVEDRKDWGHDTILDEDHDMRVEAVANYQPYEPKSEGRSYEVNMMHYLLNRISSTNPDKIFLWFPGDYSITYDKETEQEFSEVFHQVDQIIGQEVIDRLQGLDRQSLFYNGNHLNMKGRALTTQMWIEILDEDLSKFHNQ